MVTTGNVDLGWCKTSSFTEIDQKSYKFLGLTFTKFGKMYLFLNITICIEIVYHVLYL
jgi:hypothetical protein